MLERIREEYGEAVADKIVIVASDVAAMAGHSIGYVLAQITSVVFSEPVKAPEPPKIEVNAVLAASIENTKKEIQPDDFQKRRSQELRDLRVQTEANRKRHLRLLSARSNRRTRTNSRTIGGRRRC